MSGFVQSTFVPSTFVPGTLPPDQQHPACYVVISQQQLLMADQDASWQPIPHSTWRFLDVPQHQQLFLGWYSQQAAYAIEVDANQYPAPPGFRWQPLRGLLGLLGSGSIGESEFHLVSCGMQLFNWERDHQFCGRCGNHTVAHKQDRARRCDHCELDFYPRLSPCVIMLVRKGEECLLARHHKSRGNWYSTLAGFIEPGESAENAVHREVAEEVGIQIHNLQFFSSQPWPFPSQLMLGFHADYLSGDIVIDDAEIADARWWHYRDLPMVPPEGTLSGQLIGHFVKQMTAKP